MKKLRIPQPPFFIAVVTLLAVLATGCGKETTTIQIASKDFTEQYILGEILTAMVLEHTDLDVKLTAGVAGETSIIMPAMEKGDFDLYPEYDSTAWMTVLKKPKNTDLEEMHREMEEIYREEYDMQWMGFYGFDNTYSIAVRKETADEYGLETISDLAEHSENFIFGAGFEFFEREDGYQGFQELYDFEFKEILEMNLSLKYNALLDKQVDAITIYKTDGRMASDLIVELEDDRDYFPPALCGTIIRSEVLAEHPELGDAITMLTGIISNDDMRKMNASVDMEGRDAQSVALEFLQQKGLIDDK